MDEQRLISMIQHIYSNTDEILGRLKGMGTKKTEYWRTVRPKGAEVTVHSGPFETADLRTSSMAQQIKNGDTIINTFERSWREVENHSHLDIMQP